MFQKVSNYLFGGNSNNTKNTTEEKPKFEYALNKNEKQQVQNLEDKPKIVAVYDKSGGTAYCDLTIEYLESKGMEVITVTPDEGLAHPAFKGTINGIFLPGGPNVAVNNPQDPRTKFEGELTELASTQDIPLMGTCRGAQTLGHHNGYHVKDLPEDSQQREPHYKHDVAIFNETQDPNYNNKVVVTNGSQLYNNLRRKLKQTDDSDIEYHVTCLHHQHVQDDSNNNSLQVTGRNKFDNLPESFEKKHKGKFYSIGFQHHPEAIISSCKEERKEKIAKLKEQAEDDGRFSVNPYDIDHLYTQYTYAKKIDEARVKTRGEKAAGAELGFFKGMVRQHSLDNAPKIEKQKGENPGDFSFPGFEPWRL